MLLVSLRALSLYLDVSRETISDWIDKGAFKRRKDGKLDQQACIRSLVKWQSSRLAGRPSGGLDLSAERAKLAQEQTEAQKLKNAIARADYVKTEDVAQFMADEYAVVREKSLTMVGKIADRLGEGDPARRAFAEKVVGDEVYETLNELSNPADLDFTPDGLARKDQGRAPGAAPAAEAHPDRVGEQVPPSGDQDHGEPGALED